MFIFFILLLGISKNHAASLIQNFTGSLDELGVCHCSVVLPDSTFPADRFEMLEMSNQNMTITVEQQINKGSTDGFTCSPVGQPEPDVVCHE